MRVGIALAVPLMLLAACQRGEDAPGRIAEDDRDRLNDAAVMLDTNSIDAAAVTNRSDGR